MLDAGRLQGTIELGVRVRSDVRVGARLQRQNRRLHLAGPLDRARTAGALAGDAIEADRACQSVAARSREPGVVASEAETQREHCAAAFPAQPLDRGAHVRLDAFRSRLVDVLAVLEVLSPF